MKLALHWIVGSLLLLSVAAVVPDKAKGIYFKFLIPKSCPTATKECCPSSCNNANGAGNCTDVTSESLFGQSHVDSMIWVTQNFSKVCLCGDRFTGPGCGECNFGYENYPTCSKIAKIRVRKDWRNLTSTEKTTFYDAIKKLTTVKADSLLDISKWHWHALFHWWVNIAYQDVNWNYAHNGPGFPGWHRMYLLRLERDLQTVLGDTTWSFPYWDWRDSTGYPNDVVINDLGGDGDSSVGTCASRYLGTCDCPLITGPFANWPCYRGDGEYFSNLTRAIKCAINDTELDGSYNAARIKPPRGATVAYAWKNNQYDRLDDEESFNALMEGRQASPDPNLRTIPSWPTTDLHNYLHVYIAGIMGASEYAGNEPLFWLHHNFVDSWFDVWARKILRNGFKLMPWQNVGRNVGHGYDEVMSPFFPLRKNSHMYRVSTEFGYTHQHVEEIDNAPCAATLTCTSDFVANKVTCATSTTTTSAASSLVFSSTTIVVLLFFALFLL